MKIHVFFLGLLTSLFLLSQAYAADLSATKSLGELARVSRTQALKIQKDRACEIQLHEKIPPTLCYSRKGMSSAELDQRCQSFAAVAARLPRIDESTSAACKEVVKNRARDLAYVGGTDALR